MVRSNKKSPHNVFQYHKANFDAIVKTIADFGSSFCKEYAGTEDWDVKEMWESFKQAVLQARESYIPTKTLSSKQQSSPLD